MSRSTSEDFEAFQCELTVPVLSDLSSYLRELKNKGKVQLGNPESGSGRLREHLLTRAFQFKSPFKRHFTKVIVTRAGPLREWSLGELRLLLPDSAQKQHAKNFRLIRTNYW